MKDYDFSKERFQPFYALNGVWGVADTETGDKYAFSSHKKALDRARAWNYEAAEMELNQFREGC